MPDPLPMHHADTGCHVEPACLTCKRLLCIHDDPLYREDGRPKTTRTSTNLERVVEMFTQGESVAETAKALGISVRSVHRILADSRLT